MESSAPLTEAEILAQTAEQVKNQEKPQDEIKVLFPENGVFEVNGESLEIRLFTLGEIPKILTLVNTVAKAYGSLSTQEQNLEAYLELFSACSEDLIRLLALNVRKPREWFDTVPADIGLAMMIKFIEVNTNFFVQRLLPLMKGLK